MLLLIGLGLESKDISVKGLEALRRASKVIIERYTTPIGDEYVEYLEKELGKKLVMAERSDLEENLRRTVEEAKGSDLAILIPGDPLIATTHRIIIEEASSQGIETEVIHAASIFTAAIGASGLDVYRFGPTVTIPFWHQNYTPTSFLEALSRNLSAKEHTLILLDINPQEGRTMEIGEALSIIENASAKVKSRVINPDTKIIVLANVGKKTEKVIYSSIKYLKSDAKIESVLKNKSLCLILPCTPTFAEARFISRFEREYSSIS